MAIRTDMEGLSGVVRYAQVTPGEGDYAASREVLNRELLALVGGLREGGVESVVIYDEHVQGCNVDVGRMPPWVEVVCGKPPYEEDWAGGLDERCEGLVLHGLHAKAGTLGATLAHTYEHDILDLRINGRSVGEIAVEAAIAGELGVPLWLVVADSAGCAEAEREVSGVRTVSTKESRCADGAVCYSLERNLESIAAAAREAMERRPRVEPLVFEPPVCLEIDLKEGAYRERFVSLFGKCVCGGTARLEGKSLGSLWAKYWQMKLRALEPAVR